MRPSGQAVRLTVLLGEHDTYHHKTSAHEIVHRAMQAGMSGASVFRGVEGFGSTGTLHTTRMLSWSETMPLTVVIIDSEERIRDFLPQLDGLVPEGMVFLDRVEVIRYRGEDERE